VGLRNFKTSDASRNFSPWGLVIGGEELHNNHHTYPTSAKLAVKPYEFDIGWLYIRGMEMPGLATVRKAAPRLKLGTVSPVADDKTLDPIIVHRYELMADYVRRWLHRDEEIIPNNVKAQVAGTQASSPYLAKLVAMREELRMLWTRKNVCAEQRVPDLQAWLVEAEQTDIGALQQFGLRLHAARV